MATKSAMKQGCSTGLPDPGEAALSGGALLHAGVHRRASKEVRARGPFGEGDGHCGRQIRPEVPVEA